MIQNPPSGRFSFAIAASTIATILLTGGPVAALSQDQAIEQCRERVGRPRVMACVQNLMRTRGGPPQQFIEGCRAPVKPLVMACVKQALMKANGRPDVPLAMTSGKKKDDVSLELALKSGFVPPPRTIADITAVLDSEKPDRAKVDERKSVADSEPKPNLAKRDLAEFYKARADARAELGQSAAAIKDGKRALETGKDVSEPLFLIRVRQFVGLQYMDAGDLKNGIATFEQLIRAADAPGTKGMLFNAYRQMVGIQIQAGDIQRSETFLRRSEALLKEARTSPFPGWRTSYAQFGRSWEGDVEAARGALFEARGQTREAELAYVKAEKWSRSGAEDILKTKFAPTASQLMLGGDFLTLATARVKSAQGRAAEGEADARRALLSRLKDQGKYVPSTVRFVNGLAGQMVAQGRYADAEKILRTALEIQRVIGQSETSPLWVGTLAQLASSLNFQFKSREAVDVYQDIDKATAAWDVGRKDRLTFGASRVISLYAAGQIEEGVKLAEDQVKRSAAQFGENNFSTAVARGNLAVGHMRSRRLDDAVREFRTAIPVLMNASHESAADESGANVNAVTGRLQIIVETYISMLSRSPERFGGDVATETFALADAVRGQSVQNAVGASSARAGVKDPALAEIVRKEQDLSKRIAAQQVALNNALASDLRDDKSIKATTAALEKARAEIETIRRDITRRFPSYADLINPKPPSIAQIKATLKDGESLLSFYFGRQASFVWAVPKDGPPAFASIAASPGELQSKIRKVRESLEPSATMIAEIPAFDIPLAYNLYELLLKPVESGWKKSNSLIVVTNGALGLLPLSLLPTDNVQIDANEATLFEGYRRVPWLARTHAVTVVPSSSAILTLRQLPASSSARSALLAFGDPIFSTEQAEQSTKATENTVLANAANVTRGLPLKRRNSPNLDGVDSAELALLPRLPDTADELTSIAQALSADPAKFVNLGKAANEGAVKSANLSGFKVLAFATHGLVPGELNGLTQPALALSAPAVAGTDGDGLLTMEEILALKLDADWVVLSACNTGAASGAGAEAASGLGRAFFYAGTRALLITNWSVHSQSARELVTDLFKRQADDNKLSRGEALRQAMMAMVDGPGYAIEKGTTEFVYAHPLFWAPYTIIGDSDRR